MGYIVIFVKSSGYSKHMKKLAELKEQQSLKYILSDIDDTMTDEGELRAAPYKALWDLHEAGRKVIPVTGRPAGWCEMIARLWPVDGVIGENGALYFRYDRHTKKMNRCFAFKDEERELNQQKLKQIEKDVLQKVPGCQIASDQFSRLTDLAVDFAEDVKPLPEKEVLKIKAIFEQHGATAKVSSIHVNGWFGKYDKVTTALRYLKTEFKLTDAEVDQQVAFVGDSPNDEPMFARIPNSFGVANVLQFKDQIKKWPRYVADSTGGGGFCEIARALLIV
jgi:HAD superfamily hydrolase (TIGR01484 family)